MKTNENFVFTPLQEKWLEALESGKYEQGQCFLNKHGRYCCLGVACEVANGPATIADDEGVLSWTSGAPKIPSQNDVKDFSFWSEDGELHEEFCTDGVLPDGLVDLNDTEGWTFKQIANFIRKYPRAVFKKGANDG